ncbi:OsmC family protein [bacterium]|nr:OsmC family protein [bacterium]
MKVRIKRIEGLTLAAISESNHWVVADTVETLDGSDGAARPMEMVLMALGTCTGMDVLSIIKKMHIELDNFEMRIDAERAPEHPKVYTKITLTYQFFGKDIDPEKVAKAVDLSQNKYCAISAMLKNSVEIIPLIEINPE